uniref:(California timema) hypothetical protein n=1 Tax=Timema californicum TaxID=61474 RepID=A0A7R9JG28_TIMCA|nr:unnamed protein product [Timema californicum]
MRDEDKSKYKVHIQLNISNFENADIGQYHCIAKNDMGITKGIFTLFGERNYVCVSLIGAPRQPRNVWGARLKISTMFTKAKGNQDAQSDIRKIIHELYTGLAYKVGRIAQLEIENNLLRQEIKNSQEKITSKPTFAQIAATNPYTGVSLAPARRIMREQERKCEKEGHKAKNCKEKVKTCIPCSSRKKHNCKNPNHRECPKYQMLLDRLILKTNYDRYIAKETDKLTH